MRDAVSIVKWRLPAIMLLVLWSIVSVAFGATNAEGLIQVQHVHLVGDALPGFYKKLMDLRISQCAMLGTPVNPPPPGVSLHETVVDNYYAPGAMASYSGATIYTVNMDCTLVREDTLKITTWTALGVCYTNRETKRSTGNCDVDIASLSLPHDPKSISKNIVLDGESTLIAGHSCTFLNSKIFGSSRTCIAREGVFAKVVTNGNMSYGAPLKVEFRGPAGGEEQIGTSEATEIHTNIMIPITTLAPQLSGKYKVISDPLPKTDSRP